MILDIKYNGRPSWPKLTNGTRSIRTKDISPSFPIYRALHTGSPGIFNCSASLASSHSCSLSSVFTIATSPIPRGLTLPLLLPEHISLRSLNDIKTRWLGLLTSSILVKTGWSSRYLRFAHIRRSYSLALLKAAGSGPAIVPRVIDEMKPARRRMLRIPRLCLLWFKETSWRLARNAFWIFEQMSWGSGIPSGYNFVSVWLFS